jgi:hypothetical protein
MKRKSARQTSIVLPTAAVVAGFLGFVLIGSAATNAFSDGKVLGVQIAKGEEEMREAKSRSERKVEPTRTEHTEVKTERTEVKAARPTSTPKPIRVRTKDGEKSVDVTSEGTKTHFEYREDKVVVKAEDESGEKVELREEALPKVSERLDEDRIKITPTKDEDFVLQRGSTAARTQFPLSVDLATNQLIVETPSGQSNIVVLPDQAILNLLTNNVISKVDSESTTGEGMDDTTKQAITLNEEDGVPVYEVKGVSEQRMFWLIPVKIKKSVKVSTDTGEVVSEDASFLDKVADLLSV